MPLDDDKIFVLTFSSVKSLEIRDEHYIRGTSYAIQSKNGSLSQPPASRTPAGNFFGVSRRAIVTTRRRGWKESESESDRATEGRGERCKKSRVAA